MNLPAPARFEGNAYQASQALQQQATRAQVRDETSRAQSAALLSGYIQELQLASGAPAKQQLMQNMAQAGLAAGQGQDPGMAVAKYIGLM